MFSKAKRFPEAGKDYIPGPGEYDLTVDDMGRHKRYGFLTQTNRFNEGGLEGITTSDINEQDHTISTHRNESTTSLTSISSDTRLSSTSSIRTTTPTDEHSPTLLKSPSHLRKSPTSPIEATSQLYHKNLSQKEMEALQAKLHKMEATIESLEADKNNTKAILITKDLEMADLRSKNATLQKTIHRQEKSAKTAQLQKKVEQLEEQLVSLKSELEKEIQDKNKTCEEFSSKLNRSDAVIEELQFTQREKEKEIEALEAQNKSFTVQISEFECKMVENETQINNLQHQLKDMKVTHTELLHDLEKSKQQLETLEIKNGELLAQIQENSDTISHLETRVTLKDEEIDALLNTIEERDQTIEEKLTLIENIQTQFKTYRQWIDHTVIPHLRLQRKETENHHYAELNLLLTELHEAKKFINRQAQFLNGLKSDVHWLNVQNNQLTEIITSMIKDQKEFFTNNSSPTNANTTKKKVFPTNVFKPKRKQVKVEDIIPTDASDTATLSFSSRSTISNNNSTHSNRSTETESSPHSNVLVLNDSGFGLLVDEAK